MDRRFDRAWQVPLTMVVGPAGAGKTTAASHLVHRSGRTAAWYRAHLVDGDEATFCAHLGQALAHATGTRHESADLARLVADVESWSGRQPVLVVIDEFDALIGTDGERALGEILADLGPSMHLVTLSRRRPTFNVSRLRLGSGVCEIGPDDLRFRSWEVDELFRDLYGRPLLPDEVADLERRSGGWIAALQLFNLATTALPAGERRAAIARVGRRNGPDWDFLAENVITGLSDELQLFLLETAPIERLTASVCDDLLDSRTSEQHLAQLERLQLVTSSMEAPGSYRSHEILRSHLDGLLIEWEGVDGVHKRYRRAAETLERHGRFAEALRAYCRGEDWASASRLLGARGAEVAERPGSWLLGLPAAMVEADPWLLLAVARQQRAEGRVSEAIESYQRVEHAALTSVPVAIARRERLLLSSLLDRSSPPSLPWVAAIRDMFVADPLTAIAALENRSTHELLATGIGRLLAGEVRLATQQLGQARDRADASPTVAVAAGIGLLVAAHLAGTADTNDADELERAAAALEIPFLVRLSRAAAAMVIGSREQAESVVDECDRAGDRVGAAGAALLAALGDVWGAATGAATGAHAFTRCRELGLRTLEVWMQVALALDGSAVDRHQAAAAAESAARRRGLRALQALAEIAVLAAAGSSSARATGLAAALRADHGLTVPASVVASTDAVEPAPRAGTGTPVRVQCFGRFVMTKDDVVVELGPLRPRARAILRMLAVHVGTGVHRHALCDQLWPDDDEATAAKKLHVAISSIRRILDPDSGHEVLRRDGDIYLLDADRVHSDVRQFSDAVTRGRSLLTRNGGHDAEPLLRQALACYEGDLLPEDGAAEWVVGQRQQYRSTATDVARSLGTYLLDQTRPAEAIAVCRTGLDIDRYSDPLWRLLLTALQADADPAGHAVAAADYDAVLEELGVRRA